VAVLLLLLASLNAPSPSRRRGSTLARADGLFANKLTGAGQFDWPRPIMPPASAPIVALLSI
jgi:hypothetical protein